MLMQMVGEHSVEPEEREIQIAPRRTQKATLPRHSYKTRGRRTKSELT
jgi:hypothetical protein